MLLRVRQKLSCSQIDRSVLAIEEHRINVEIRHSDLNFWIRLRQFYHCLDPRPGLRSLSMCKDLFPQCLIVACQFYFLFDGLHGLLCLRENQACPINFPSIASPVRAIVRSWGQYRKASLCWAMNRSAFPNPCMILVCPFATLPFEYFVSGENLSRLSHSSSTPRHLFSSGMFNVLYLFHYLLPQVLLRP